MQLQALSVAWNSYLGFPVKDTPNRKQMLTKCGNQFLCDAGGGSKRSLATLPERLVRKVGVAPSGSDSLESVSRSRRISCRPRFGFTTVEVIVAVVILTVGILGMAGATARVTRQISLSDAKAERTAVVRTARERIRALPYDSVVAGSDTIGSLEVSWTVRSDGQWKAVILTAVNLEPGDGSRSPSGLGPETITFRILRP